MRPIGSTKQIQVNVRILAATNRDLQAEIKNRTFRKDLFYRLNVILIVVSPLRETREDVKILASHFIQKHAIRRVFLTDEILALLRGYDWPDNVCELKNVIHRMVALKSNSLVTIEDLLSSLRGQNGEEAGSNAFEEIVPLAEVERQHILKAVEFTKGDINAAAHMLGIGRTTLYRKMKA